MTITELKEKRKDLRAKCKALREKSEEEKRFLTSEELERHAGYLRELAKTSEDIQLQEDELTYMRKKSGKGCGNGYSIRNAVANAIESGDNLLRVNIAEAESRAIDYDVTGDGTTSSQLVSNQVLNILPELRQRMLLGQAGATYLTGLVGNITIPAFGGGKANWAGENAAAASGKGTFTYVNLSPKRLTAVCEISGQLLKQNGQGVDSMIENDIVEAIAAKLEATLLGGEAGSATQPAGLFNGVGAAVDLNWDNVVGLETAADSAATLTDNAQYLMNTELWGLAKTTVKAAGNIGFILDPDKTMNGYKANRSGNVYKNGTSYGVAFGDFRELVIAQWGTLDLKIDPMTKADQDIVRIIINGHFDGAVRRSGAIATKLMKAAATAG